MPERYENIIITQRDLDIIHFVFNSQGCKSVHIKDKFFKNCIYKTAMARIKSLCDAGFILGERRYANGPIVYCIRRKGVKLLIKYGKVKQTVIKLPHITTSRIDHDFDVLDVRIALESDAVLSIGEWITEYEISSKIRKGYPGNKYLWVPDGAFTISRGLFKRPFLLEYISRYCGKEILVKTLNTIEYRYPYYSVLIVGGNQLVANSCYRVLVNRGKWLGKYLLTWKDSIIKYMENPLKATTNSGNMTTTNSAIKATT